MVLSFQRNHLLWNKIPNETRKLVIEMKNKFSGYNTLHLYDLFRERYPDKSLCYSTLRNVLISAHLYTTKIKKRRKPRKRFEKEKSGELLQMDTSRHKWIHGIDEYFSLIALRRVVEKYGVFQALYTDNDSKFKYERKNSSLYFNYHKEPDDIQTQIDMALSELRIQLLHTPVDDPESKGKVERPFGMFQDRLIKEFRDNNIRTIEEANKWLRKRIEWWNKNHIHWTTKETPDERFFRDSIFQPLPDEINLDDVFCLRTKRKVNKDNTFKFDGEVYQITEGTIRRSNWYKAEIELHIIPRKKIRVFHEDSFIQEFSVNGEKKLAKARDIEYNIEYEDILP